MTSMTDGIVNINGDNIQTLEIIFLMAMFTLLPSAVVLMTSFTRYIISLSFLRNAMGTQQTPPNMVLVGLALFLTMFTMAPVLEQISEPYELYTNEEIDQAEFLEQAQIPLKRFMIKNTDTSSIRLFYELDSDRNKPAFPANEDEAVENLSMAIVIPAFATSELKRAFEIGLYLYIPFLLVDIIVSTTLMSMGMIMLPPSMISTPFKLLLFISLNGWELFFSTLVRGFR